MLGAISVLFVAFGAAVVTLVLRLLKSFAARQAEQMRYENIGNQLREAIVLIDANSHQFVEANGTVLRALGCTRDELQTRKVQDLFPDVTPAMLGDAARADSGRKIHQTRLRRGNGVWIDSEVSITTMSDRAGGCSRWSATTSLIARKQSRRSARIAASCCSWPNTTR